MIVLTQYTTLCRCRALLVWKCQARLMLASAPGSRMDRYPYEGRPCPDKMNRTTFQKHKSDRRQHLLTSLTFTASKIRMALARSFNLRQALSAASRIFGSGTRSYPIKVFMPKNTGRPHYQKDFGKKCHLNLGEYINCSLKNCHLKIPN